MWSLQKKPEFKQKFPELSEDTQQPQVQSCLGSPTSYRKLLLDLTLLSTCYMAHPVVLALCRHRHVFPSLALANINSACLQHSIRSLMCCLRHLSKRSKLHIDRLSSGCTQTSQQLMGHLLTQQSTRRHKELGRYLLHAVAHLLLMTALFVCCAVLDF
jgi:hypothetical protein